MVDELRKAFVNVRERFRKSSKARVSVDFVVDLLKNPKVRRIKMNAMKLALSGGGLSLFGLFFGWVLFPIILNKQVHSVSLPL